MKSIFAALMILMLTGCAPLMQHLPIGETARTYRDANNSHEQGRYREAHDTYRALAESHPESGLAEQARFNAALILLYHKNPDKDYSRAEREFAEFLTRYPESRLADEAASWLDLLKNFNQNRTNQLLQEIDALKKRLKDTQQRQQEAQALVIEKSNLAKRIDDLLDDKDDLLKEKATLLKEREQLERDKGALGEKVAALAKERENLRLAKEKLEKNLRALTIVDVKMEKKRRKIK